MKTAERLIQACLALVGVVHLVPFTGVMGSARLNTLYGIAFDGPDLAILMRHRAVLFGVVGVLLLVGAVRVTLRNTALVVGLASVASFLLLALSTGRYNAQLGNVVAVDWCALVLLVGAAGLQARVKTAKGVR